MNEPKTPSITPVRLTKSVHEELKRLVREVSAELDKDVTMSDAIQYLLDLKMAAMK